MTIQGTEPKFLVEKKIVVWLLFSFQTYALLGETIQTISGLRQQAWWEKMLNKKNMATRNLRGRGWEEALFSSPDTTQPFFFRIIFWHHFWQTKQEWHYSRSNLTWHCDTRDK